MNPEPSPSTPAEPNLSGSLILAHPSLREPAFFRTVLFLTEHSPAGGARGFVLNRPMERKVGDFLGSKEFSDVWDVPIFSGGPVGSNELMFMSLDWNRRGDGIQCSGSLGLQGAKKVLSGGGQVRAFVGYAGWSPGQLEGEMTRHAWIRQAPNREALDAEAGEQLWTNLLASKGGMYRILSKAPADPGLN